MEMAPLIGVAPSLNVTVPVGVADPPLTVAVNVTDWLMWLGFRLDATLVDVDCWTVCVNADEVDVRLRESPP
jgi:hypothetical protein